MPIYRMDGKKNGKQKYRVRINYTDSYGKAKQIDRVAYGNEEAKQLERELNYKIRNNQIDSSITVLQLFKEYTSTKKYEVRQTTYEKTCRILERYVIPEFKDTKVSKLTIPMLQKWKNKISNEGLALTTRKNIYGEFRAMLNYAVKLDYLKKNPLLVAGNFKASITITDTKTFSYYTVDEFRQYISAAKCFAENSEHLGNNYDWNFYVFFNVAFYTGMRKGEINALTWKDIKGDTIHITKSVSQKAKGKDLITPPKNRSSIRNIQIPQPLNKILKEHKNRYMDFEAFSDDLYICGGTQPVRDTTLEKRNILFSEMAGLKHIRIHDFRHSHASLLANEGINIQEIARRLGHTDVAMTWNTYSHLYPREEERAIQILDKIV